MKSLRTIIIMAGTNQSTKCTWSLSRVTLHGHLL